MEKKLTKLEAFKAMMKFVEDCYSEPLPDDIAVLLSVSSLLQDDMPADSALWEDWEDALPSKNGDDMLTPPEAFGGMVKFLEGYYTRGKSTDVELILNSLEHSVDSKKINPDIWNKWLASIDYITSDKGDSYGYLELHK